MLENTLKSMHFCPRTVHICFTWLADHSCSGTLFGLEVETNLSSFLCKVDPESWSSWWLNQPIWDWNWSNWKSSPIFGVKIPKIFELPPPSDACKTIYFPKRLRRVTPLHFKKNCQAPAPSSSCHSSSSWPSKDPKNSHFEPEHHLKTTWKRSQGICCMNSPMFCCSTVLLFGVQVYQGICKKRLHSKRSVSTGRTSSRLW